ncbi:MULTISPECIES: penicillin-binding protein activator [Desulfococcus]|jgi:ABC-type branched-subunit amino acid transport system substrate-binding protein|uniref:Branched-chain amino acid ABC transporter periplasmic protein n=1 Tax=Desulfococcus multivorans DSM 2059 TaxID=1121405 RepID=S7V2X7_DESML|nr:penicillin-binding protein activator [Desulfococcus multivorans]AOY57926.1 conserved uncharacterized protein [Desulfococcus multivorans]AQV00298.1 hypothetical protein B2D07_05605 [Desulfococcus multivorans]EPR39008.1 branched-chain amino acid ABC transporter periplasmic protein [Desulfococcus multivorans DSM 2059]MDX9817652.1 penicillin-binding protein activator [Desulfococcus multivorans]SJZ65217.1 ABC-type branched-chain amino acid transport system, substrate-binding protein [Desulfococc
MNLRKISIVAAVLLLTACVSTDPGLDRTEPGAELFARAERSFRSGSYRKAMIQYDDYLSQFPTGPQASIAIFRKGEIHHRWRDYATSRQYYERVVDEYARSRFVSSAMLGILQTLYDERRYREIIQKADVFLRNSEGLERSAPVFTILGDAYAALDSPANAVYFYAKAHEQSAVPGNQDSLSRRMKAAVNKLSTAEILALSERVTDSAAQGYLIYALGMKAVDEKRYDDAVRTLSQFIAVAPEHEYAAEARRMLQDLEGVTGVMSGRHTLGCLLPLTGAYAHYGNKALQGIELALNHAGLGEAIDIRIEDTASDSNRAADAVLEMARENVTAIIGPINTAKAAALKAQDAQIPIVVLTQKPDITKIGDYVFRNFMTPQMQVQALVTYAMQMMGIQKFAILHPREKYGQVFLEAFQRELQAYAGKLVTVQSYGVKDSDFSAVIGRLRRHGDIEALFIPDGADKAGLIIPQLTYHGFSNVQLLGTNLWHSEKLIRTAGRFAQGAIFTDIFYSASPSPEVQVFVRNFRTRFGESPGFIEALAYDTTLMIIEALHAAKGGGGPAVRRSISQIRHFTGATGETRFDDTGDAVKKLQILKIEGSRFEAAGVW